MVKKVAACLFACVLAISQVGATLAEFDLRRAEELAQELRADPELATKVLELLQANGTPFPLGLFEKAKASENLEFVVNKFTFESAYAVDTQNWVKAGDGYTFIQITCEFSNLGLETTNFSGRISGTVLSGGEHAFDVDVRQVIGRGNGIFLGGLQDVGPLASAEIYLYAKLPSPLSSSEDSMALQLMVDGKLYQIPLR